MTSKMKASEPVHPGLNSYRSGLIGRTMQKYAVCKLLTWDHIGKRCTYYISGVAASGGEKIIGFIPVYENLEDAVQEGGGYQILPLYSGRDESNEEGV